MKDIEKTLKGVKKEDVVILKNLRRNVQNVVVQW